jgi:hypothetical protein
MMLQKTPQAYIAPEQEPVAWLSTDSIGERHLCFDKPLDNDPVQPPSTPLKSQRTWVGLTDEDKHEIELRAGITEDDDGYIVSQVFKLTEAKLKEKNT